MYLPGFLVSKGDSDPYSQDLVRIALCMSQYPQWHVRVIYPSSWEMLLHSFQALAMASTLLWDMGNMPRITLLPVKASWQSQLTQLLSQPRESETTPAYVLHFSEMWHSGLSITFHLKNLYKSNSTSWKEASPLNPCSVITLPDTKVFSQMDNYWMSALL